ncbi:MAG: hypothetical protein LBT62_01035 [Deltaproteobacteria bacterium]|jgi:flagellar motility protein MotE (MotC chaperone)|nr:hypothetical protein [Deltaproteobacteria bacterium]
MDSRQRPTTRQAKPQATPLATSPFDKKTAFSGFSNSKAKVAPSSPVGANKTSTAFGANSVSNVKAESQKTPASPSPQQTTKPPKKTDAQKKSILLKFLFLSAIAVLIARLILSGVYLYEDKKPISSLFETSTVAQAASPPVAAATASLASAPLAATALSAAPLSAAPMVSGAAMFMSTGSSLMTMAGQSSIPLIPEDEDLRQPQITVSEPSLDLSDPQTPAGQTPGNQTPGGQTPAGQTPTQAGNPSLPPSMTNQGLESRSEELARREFELTRRENQLATREEAIRNLENDLNIKIQAAERSKIEISDLIARNQAILDEQKAFKEEQQKQDDALKDARIEHLVAAFKGMKPEQAGALIDSMDDAVAVAILSAMPGSNAGKILAMVTPDKAARLVKSISEQRIDPKVLLEGSNLPAL